MGVYNKIVTNTLDPETSASMVAAFLNAIDGISAEAYEYEHDSNTYYGALFSIDDTDYQGFFGYRDNCYYSSGWFKKGNMYYIEPFAAGRQDEANGVLTVHAYSDPNCIMIQFKDETRWRSGICIMVTNDLVGYYKYAFNAGLDTYKDISSFTFEKAGDLSRTLLSYTNMFPYAAPAGTLDFLAKGYFVNSSNVRKYTSEFMKECSTVNELSTVSLPYPLGNHLAIGAHCIVPLDPEGGEE